MQTVTKQTLKTFWEHNKRYKWTTLFIIVSIVITSILDVIEPWLLKKLFDAFTSNDPNKMEILKNLVWYIIGVALVTQMIWRLMGYGINYLQPRVMSDLLNTCYEYLLGHSYGFFTNNFVGSIVTRIRRYPAAYEKICDTIAFELSRTFLRILFVVTLLFVWWPMLGMMMTVWCVVYLGFVYIFSIYKLKYDIQLAAHDTKTTGHLADTLTNNINLKLFTSHLAEMKSFKEITDKLYRLRRTSWNLGNHANVLQGLAMVLLNLVVMRTALGYYQQGTLTIGDFVMLQSFMGQIFDRLWEFSRSIRSIYEGLADASEMTQMLNLQHEVVDTENPAELEVREGRIAFNNVSFAYEEEGAEVLKNFFLDIKPREKVALVGASGSGKSTVIKLLLRLKDLKDGEISIDDQDISQVSQVSLRGAISVVMQDSILFHRTLMENIRYGISNATEEQVINAAKAAHAHEFISKFPEGYKTLVGERGVKLSGGERQRVTIARAILKNAPILILDEATNSLDPESEWFIQDALDALMKNKTVIVIAHRLSTIRMMDRIIVMQNGGILQQGKHIELLKEGGVYKKFWGIQAGSFVSNI